jgi:hypothetical protein
MHNLIPNGSFETGLSEWEATPSGVTLIKTEAKRFVMLQAGTRSAAICSDPIAVEPGAAYIVEIERALRGDCEVAVISPNELLKPDHAGEVVPSEDKVRVQVTARPGEKVGIAKVLLVPVGERLHIEAVRSTAGFRKSGEPFEILCEIKNTGSQRVGSAVARLISDSHELLEEHRGDQPVAAIGVGESRTVSWPIRKQKTAYADFQIEVEYSGVSERARGSTLRHLPKPPDVKPNSAIATGRRWFSVGSRALRITAHETDLEYGPAVLTTASGEEAGIFPALAQLVMSSGSVLPLWSKVKSSGPGGVELAGKNEYLEWSMTLAPDVATKGVGVELRASARKRLVGATLEILPFQTLANMHDESGALILSLPKDSVNLMWAAKSPRLEFETVLSAASGLICLRSEPFTLTPGLLRVSAQVMPAARAMAKR